MKPRKTVSSGDIQVWRDRNDQLHREDGPAVIYPDGSEDWYWHGKLHREDGPAVTRPDGRRELWFEGKYYDDEFVFRMMVASKP